MAAPSRETRIESSETASTAAVSKPKPRSIKVSFLW